MPVCPGAKCQRAGRRVPDLHRPAAARQWPAEARRLPSGLKATPATIGSCAPCRVRAVPARSAGPSTRTVRSWPAEARCRPSGLKATPMDRARCGPGRVSRSGLAQALAGSAIPSGGTRPGTGVEDLLGPADVVGPVTRCRPGRCSGSTCSGGLLPKRLARSVVGPSRSAWAVASGLRRGPRPPRDPLLVGVQPQPRSRRAKPVTTTRRQQGRQRRHRRPPPRPLARRRSSAPHRPRHDRLGPPGSGAGPRPAPRAVA